MALKVAFYGAGRRAQPYLQVLAQRPDVCLTAVCDLDRRAAEQTAAGWGARVYLSYEAMLQEARPDALWICVAPHLQGDVILKATELSIPLFVEPPGAMDYQRALQYGRQIAAANLVTTVGFTGRYTDVVQEAREYLGANPIPLALGWWLGQPEDEVAATAESLLWTDACRFVDVFRSFCGEVSRVRALGARAGPIEGGLVSQMEFASGSVGILTCSTFTRPEPRVEVEFMGEGWSLSFGDGLATLRLAERDKTTTLRCRNTPAADQVAAFLAASAAGSPGLIAASYSDALHTLAVCHAIALSAREGRTVDLAEIRDQGSGVRGQGSALTPDP